MTKAQEARRDGYVEYCFKEDGVYAIYHPPTEGGQALELDKLQMELLEKGLAGADEETVLRIVKEPGKPVKVAEEVEEEQRKDATVSVRLSSDEMQAYLSYRPSFGGKELTPQDLLEALQKENVVYGVNEKLIEEILTERRPLDDVLIAEGKQVEDGKPARIEYLVDFGQKNLKPKELEDGRVDYREVATMFYVEQGTELARKIPATPGDDGKAVTGKILKARQGKDIPLPVGKGTKVSERDPLLIVAAESGYPTLSGKKVSVLPLYKVEKDVDFSTGNIYFTGNVEIRGSIKPGFKVVASGNIEVNGRVEGGFLEAGGDILVKGGIIGLKRSRVKAGGILRARFIEQARVEAVDEVRVGEEIFHSEVISGEKVTMEGRHGQITGGKIMATSLISARNFGNYLATETHLFVGRNPHHTLSRERWQADVQRTAAAIKEMEASIRGYYKKTRALPSEDSKEGKVLMRLQRTKSQLQARLRYYVDQLKALEKENVADEKARVECTGVCFPGVRVHILDYIYEVNEEMRKPLFFLGEEKVEVSIRTGGKKEETLG